MSNSAVTGAAFLAMICCLVWVLGLAGVLGVSKGLLSNGSSSQGLAVGVVFLFIAIPFLFYGYYKLTCTVQASVNTYLPRTGAGRVNSLPAGLRGAGLGAGRGAGLGAALTGTGCGLGAALTSTGCGLGAALTGAGAALTGCGLGAMRL